MDPDPNNNNNTNNSTDIKIHYTTHNPTAPTTILLIHGAFVSHSNWDLVVPHLSSTYHLLIPDLPNHGQSSHLPFSLESASESIATLIRIKAHNARAHIIGHSLGAHVAIHLAQTNHDLVDMVFVSGLEMYPRTSLMPAVPYAAWATQRIENALPRSVIRWAMDGTDIPRSDPNICTLDLCKRIVECMCNETWPSSWSAKTLIVAAGKGGWVLPTSDHPHDAIRLMGIAREGNPESIACVHYGMRHPWNRQDPKLFADTARAWFERGEVGDEFVRLG